MSLQLEKFKQAVILTGPAVNIQSAFKMLHESGVICDTSKSVANPQVLVCENTTIVEPYLRDGIPTIDSEKVKIVPIMFWQTHMWWDFYHNRVYRKTPRVYTTINIFKQLQEFKEEICIWK